MLSKLMKFFEGLLSAKGDHYVHSVSEAGGRQDVLLWYKDSGQHFNGEFSMAVVQANNLLEDQTQLESGCLSSNETGPHGTFVDIYDGHGGPETSRFINAHLFQHLKRFTAEHQYMSVEVIKKAFQATEDGRLVKATGEVLTNQLSTKHNASIESVRQELQSLHPDDSHIVVLKHNVWRVKGLIQFSKSIGDVYLKKVEFNREPLYQKI
ncbi:[pyruvate dehydrogenase (acetyl-transferring)]-phosphatase [Salvia divinorum]|uniref:[pyruvate dehydrogenase (Acetyl-transferring)]-phosphatase n=1 Tax=Salvia divinorum TaxID=28513 RepID=A0ABD1I8C7_SALDI